MREEDDRAKLYKAVNNAMKKGLEKGILKGAVQENVKTVLKLYKKKKTPVEIADLLDMDIEKINQIIAAYP